MSNSKASLAPEPDVIADIGTSLSAFIDSGMTEERLEAMLASIDLDRREVVRRLFTAAQRHSAYTEWSLSTLLKRIGCVLRQEDDLATLPKDRIHNCERFLALLCEAADAVSTLPNRRAVTMTFAELVGQTGRNAQGLASLFEEGDPSPWQYVRLGEVAQAARAVRLNAQVESPEERDESGPYGGERRVHVSTPRLDAYIHGDREALGDSVYEEIGRHLESCETCRAAAEYRRGRLAVY
jgi:hypothetical protein